MKIKIFLYSICFISCFVGIQTTRADVPAYKVEFFLGSALTTPSTKGQNAGSPASNDHSTSTLGIVSDIIVDTDYGHAIAIDYYRFRKSYKGTYVETYGTPRTELQLEADVEERYDGLLLGYRYHFPFGLYLGGGLLYLNNPGINFSVNYNEFGNSEVIARYKSVRPLVFTLGYNYISEGGFVIGLHLFRSLPIDTKFERFYVDDRSLDLTNDITSGFELKDDILQSLGLGIGFIF